MRLCYDLDEENNTKPTFKWVRIVKLVNGCYLVCSCNLYENIGIGFVHVATTIDDMTVHFWHIIRRKSCSFYYLREGTTESMNKMFEDLELINPPPGVCFDNVPSYDNCPFYHLIS